MNIYTLRGKKVKCITLSGGYNYHQEIGEKHLVVGKEYTIERTHVGSWHTDVFLQEFPGVDFNSVFFENVDEQSHEENKNHPDYHKYH